MIMSTFKVLLPVATNLPSFIFIALGQEAWMPQFNLFLLLIGNETKIWNQNNTQTKKKQSTFLNTSTIHLHYRSNATWIINHQWYVVLTSSLNNQWSNAIFQEKIMPSMLESCHSRAYIVTFPPAAYLSYLDEKLKGHATVLHVTCSYLLGGKS